MVYVCFLGERSCMGAADVLFNDMSDDAAGRDERIDASEDDVEVVEAVDFISFLRWILSVIVSVA